MIIRNNPFKHGVYRLDEKTWTFSKLEAIQLAKATGKWAHWDFNEGVFKNIDWKTKPLKSPSEYYSERCRQIRQAYDYVVLFFSGGSDSTNILTHWITAGCKIDEIATMCNVNGSRDVNSYMNEEVFKLVIPYINVLKEDYEFKFRLIDISEDTVKFVEKNKKDYPFYVTNHFSPNNIVKANFRERIADYKNIINSGKSLCFVWGSEKPQIFPDFEQKKHYLQFFDLVDNCISPYTQANISNGWYDELFYWTPDLPEMIVAQAHKLLDYTRLKPDESFMKMFFQEKQNRYGYNWEHNQYLSSKASAGFLYPNWDMQTFSNGKPTNVVFSERDKWFWEGNGDNVNIMKSMVQFTADTYGSQWMNDPNDIKAGIKCHASPRYYLE